MMFKVVVLALAVQVLGVVAPKPTVKPTVAPTEAPAAPTCSDFLVDQCAPAQADDPQVEVIHKTGIEECDWYCSVAYADKCKFFIQDLAQNICEIWKIEEVDYRAKCTKHEGPRG